MKTFADLFAPLPRRISLARVRRTRGRCSNCHARKKVALFIKGGQICARCVSKSSDIIGDAQEKVQLLRRMRRLHSA
jgi:hypothetical protein